jgi:hypothetical protein
MAPSILQEWWPTDVLMDWLKPGHCTIMLLLGELFSSKDLLISFSTVLLCLFTCPDRQNGLVAELFLWRETLQTTLRSSVAGHVSYRDQHMQGRRRLEWRLAFLAFPQDSPAMLSPSLQMYALLQSGKTWTSNHSLNHKHCFPSNHVQV